MFLFIYSFIHFSSLAKRFFVLKKSWVGHSQSTMGHIFPMTDLKTWLMSRSPMIKIFYIKMLSLPAVCLQLSPLVEHK